jgi:hypothetical protein
MPATPAIVEILHWNDKSQELASSISGDDKRPMTKVCVCYSSVNLLLMLAH